MDGWKFRCTLHKFPSEIVVHVEGPFDSEYNTCRYVPERTCHIVKTWSDSDYDEDWRYRCSECGCFIPVDERDPETGDVISAANYCPSCGRRVIG